VPDQNGTDAVITAQQVPAPDNQDVASGWFEVEGGADSWILRTHTIPLMTNFDSSLPVLPS
jgi:hypothetical protein